MEAVAKMNNEIKNRIRLTWYRSDSDAQSTGAIPVAKINNAVVRVIAISDACKSFIMLGMPIPLLNKNIWIE
jgi:hypothetical protein